VGGDRLNVTTLLLMVWRLPQGAFSPVSRISFECLNLVCLISGPRRITHQVGDTTELYV